MRHRLKGKEGVEELAFSILPRGSLGETPELIRELLNIYANFQYPTSRIVG